MKATPRHIYLCRTANISGKTCVVVKQIQSNQQWTWYFNETILWWKTQSNFLLLLLWQFKVSLLRRNMRGFSNQNKFRCLSSAPTMLGSDFFMHSATKVKCNSAVISVVHSEIKMTTMYFIDFRWYENCCNSLHKYKYYPKTNPQ